MEKDAPYYVYILYSSSHDRYYTGQTSDLEKRLSEHNAGESRATKYGTPWNLKWSMKVSNIGDAMELEQKIKKRGAKRFIRDQKQ